MYSRGLTRGTVGILFRRFSSIPTPSNSTQTFNYEKKSDGKSTHIVWSDGLLTKADREKIIGRKGCTIWLTGYSGSGKSTIACALEHALLTKSKATAFRLDGDNIRFGLNKDLTFTDVDRAENIRRIGEVAKLFADSGTIAITAFISPFRKDREGARKIHEEAGVPFIEVLVEVPLAVAEARDPKQLYKKARAGLIKGFTGVDPKAIYEIPINPEIRLPTHELGVDQSVEKIMTYLQARALIAS